MVGDLGAATPREEANIRSDAQVTERRWWLVVAILALVGAVLVLLSTAKYGAGLSPDSVGYLDAARSLASGKGFGSLVWWPPLYPMLLAFVSFATGLAPTAFAHFVNAVLFALVIYLSAQLLHPGSRRSVAYSLLGVCAVLFARPFSEVYAMAWSECLFIPLVLLYLIFAQRYWGIGDVLSLAVMTLSTALACLTRYVGIALVPAGVLTIILATGVHFRTRLTRACAFAAFSLAPLGLWAMRNHRLTGTFFGNRGPLQKTLADSVKASAQATLSWYVPAHGMAFIVLAGIAIALVAVISLRAVRERALSSLKAILSDHPSDLLFMMTYFVVLLVAAARDAVPESRTLSPIYVPATLVLMKLGLYLFGPTQSRTTAFASRAPLVLLALWLCFPLTSTARDTSGRLRDGAGGCNTKEWRESETVAYAKQKLCTNDHIPVYSNGPDILWALAGVSANWAPRKVYYGSTKPANELGDLSGRWPSEGEAYLVWFKNKDRPWLFPVEELAEIANVVEIARLSDGSIYKVSVRQTMAQP